MVGVAPCQLCHLCGEPTVNAHAGWDECVRQLKMKIGELRTLLELRERELAKHR